MIFIGKRSQNIVISRFFFTVACDNLADSADQDQTARFVQSDVDLHCPQKQLNLVPAL